MSTPLVPMRLFLALLTVFLLAFSAAAPAPAATARINSFNATRIYVPPFGSPLDKFEYDYEMSWSAPSDRMRFRAISYVDNRNPFLISDASYFSSPVHTTGSTTTSPNSEGLGKHYEIHIRVTNALASIVYAHDTKTDDDWY